VDFFLRHFGIGGILSYEVSKPRHFMNFSRPQSYEKAFELSTLAANQGLAGAQFNLGILYYNGKSVVQSTDMARKSSKKS